MTTSVNRLVLDDALAHQGGFWQGGDGEESPFSGRDWLEAWAAAAPPNEQKRVTVLAGGGSGGYHDAVLPLRWSRTRFRRVPVQMLGWAIGDEGSPNHLDYPARLGASAESLAKEVLSLPWQVCRFGSIAEDAVNVPRLMAELAALGCDVRRRVEYVCPFLDLPSSWDAYLASRTKSRRQAIRYRERALLRGHNTDVSFHDLTTLDDGWRQLMDLHRARRPEGSAFTGERIQAMHRHFAAACAKHDNLWLATMRVDGEPAAAWYGFAGRDTLYFYQSGYDPAWRKEGVGQVLIGLVMQRAIDRGLRRFDFLCGSEPYKFDWTSTTRPCFEWRALRSGLAGAPWRTLDWLADRRVAAAATRSARTSVVSPAQKAPANPQTAALGAITSQT